MWRRALLAAAAVSYLICVLVMSGMQKEDLDVSMLQKLRRYNVNFDDINNEQIRQQCASRNNGFTTDVQKGMKEDYVSTTEYKSTNTTEAPLPSVSLNMDSVINYLKTRDDSVRYSDETTTRKTTRQEMDTHVTEHIENQPKIDMDILRRYIQLETQKKSFYKLDDNSETNNHYAAIHLKENEKNSNTFDNGVIIDNLLKDYLYKQQRLLTTTEYATPRYTIDVKNIYKKIEEIIANGPNKDNEEDKMVENYPGTGGDGNTKHNVIRPIRISIQSQKRQSTGNRLLDSFYNFLNEMNRFQNNSSQSFPTYDENVYSKDNLQMDKSLLPFNENDQHNYKEFTTHKTDSEIQQNQKTLTPILVKEIAETVRKVIIKDIRNELADIYLKTTQTTQDITTTIKTTTETSSKSTTQVKDLSIIDKFMDLYEQVKSLQQATFSSKPKNETATFVNVLKQSSITPVKSAIFMPPVNGLPFPDTKVSISSVGNYNTKHFFNYNPYIPRTENNHRSPITLQTNSVEIQPLAVRISKPESIIRQNIVVHPGNRFQGRDDKVKHLSLRGNRYSDLDIPKKYNNRTHKYSPFKRYDGYNSARYPIHNLQEPQNREDVIRFKLRDNGNSRLDTDYYEKINFGNDHSAAKEKLGIFNNRNIPKFHERLERVDTGSDGAPVVSDNDMTGKQGQSADLPSRYQLPLVDMKKGSSYDDLHFKNFLKTQQKVTDMLEKILATRPKSNTPRSVETV